MTNQGGVLIHQFHSPRRHRIRILLRRSAELKLVAVYLRILESNKPPAEATQRQCPRSLVILNTEFERTLCDLRKGSGTAFRFAGLSVAHLPLSRF